MEKQQNKTLQKDKTFYYLKLQRDFMEGEKIDFLMSQKDGANYVVLYQMLIIKAINTNGTLATFFGETIIPFNIEKIQRDCKWFTVDTIRVALELYSKLGMIYLIENNVYQIADFNNYVGSKTYWAERKQLQRKEKKEKEGTLSNVSPISSYSYILSLYKLTKKQNNIIEEWCQYKKEKKKEYKETGFKQLVSGIVNTMKKYNYTEDYMVSCIKNSMAHNWEGIFWKTDDEGVKVTNDENTEIEEIAENNGLGY